MVGPTFAEPRFEPGPGLRLSVESRRRAAVRRQLDLGGGEVLRIEGDLGLPALKSPSKPAPLARALSDSHKTDLSTVQAGAAAAAEASLARMAANASGRSRAREKPILYALRNSVSMSTVTSSLSAGT